MPTVQHAQNATICTSSSPICEEDKIIAALKQIRSYNSETRTIFYLNSVVNVPFYNLSTQFFGENEKYLLHDQNGKLFYPKTQCNTGPNQTIFDLSQNQTITLWLETIKYAMSAQGLVDGIFVDEVSWNIAGFQRRGCLNITDEKVEQFNNGHVYMMQEAQKIVTSLNKERGILISNNADISGVNGRMFENFRFKDSWAQNSDGSSNDVIALMNEKNNRVSQIHGESNNNSLQFACNQTLAAFLIAANEYSYYGCTDGWTLQDGWDEIWQNPDYQKALGEPKSEAIYDNETQIYRREFASGTKVWMDWQWQSFCIQWSDGTITTDGNITDCDKY